MNNEDVAGVLLDLADAFESASVKLRRRCKEFGDKNQCKWNPDDINWVKTQGSRGEYERSEDLADPQFKTMLKDLTGRGGKALRQGYFYWVFKEGSVVGRKKKSSLRRIRSTASAIS